MQKFAIKVVAISTFNSFANAVKVCSTADSSVEDCGMPEWGAPGTGVFGIT